MIHDDPNQNEQDSSDSFWGSTPDWTDSTRRPRRNRSKARDDVTGAIKNLWGAAMASGSEGTREHHVIDATAPRPTDDTPVIGPTMFDDLDTEVPLWTSGRVDAVRAEPVLDRYPTNEVPVVDATAPALHDFDDEEDDDGFAAMTPVPLIERDDNRRGLKGGVDPLLVRIGAAAVVTTLLVPLAIALTSDDGNGETIASAADQPALDVADPTTSDAADGATDATVVLDPETLPPAVPVNPTPTSSGSESADSSSSSSAPASSATSDATTTSTDSSASAAVADTCAIDYDVQFGDFWLRLAEGAGVPLADLLDVNGATNSTPLYPDTTICLPAGSSTPAPPVAPTTAAPTTAAPTTAAPTTAAPTTAAPTTAAPTTTEPPAPSPDPSPVGTEEIKQIIREVWPDDLEDRALEIAFRESRYVPTAKNYCCYGLFQIYWSVHKSWLGDLGITDDQQLYDPATNARAAYGLYQRAGGWAPWNL